MDDALVYMVAVRKKKVDKYVGTFQPGDEEMNLSYEKSATAGILILVF